MLVSFWDLNTSSTILKLNCCSNYWSDFQVIYNFSFWVLPDLRFSDLGFITRLFDRLTRRDLLLTSLRNVQARSCIRPMGWLALLVGVTQYCVANIVSFFSVKWLEYRKNNDHKNIESIDFSIGLQRKTISFVCRISSFLAGFLYGLGLLRWELFNGLFPLPRCACCLLTSFSSNFFFLFLKCFSFFSHWQNKS